MRRGSSPPAVCPAAALTVLVLAACRLAPAEAPPPNAAAWPGDGPSLAPADPADEPTVVADAVAVEPPLLPARPRPPRTIFRDELDRATGPGPAYLLRQLGPEPFRHEGHFVGWEITQLFPDDPQMCAHGCDVAVGDVILGVNGHRLQTPQDLSDALAALPQWTALRVQSLREGQRRDVTYTIVLDPGV